MRKRDRRQEARFAQARSDWGYEFVSIEEVGREGYVLGSVGEVMVVVMGRTWNGQTTWQWLAKRPIASRHAAPRDALSGGECIEASGQFHGDRAQAGREGQEYTKGEWL